MSLPNPPAEPSTGQVWGFPPPPPAYTPRAPLPSPWKGSTRNILLFLLTVASVYLSGGPRLVLGLLSILMAHEMGHYVACRLYGVDATLPYFLPFPFLSLAGTLGAFIRIRGPIPHRRALFDIGIAGPLAGFALCLPVLLLGVREAQLLPEEPSAGIQLGEPLFFQGAVWLLKGATPGNMTLSIGPLGLAAWFGLFVTALNLIPIGQLDGGHVTYALFRQRAALVSRIGSWVCVALIYFGPNWVVWSIVLRMLGRRHPPTLDDGEPLGRGRAWIGALGLVVFIGCFVPNPIVWSWRDFFETIGLTSR
ncbi:MAG TPA: site-2 protease family protein [Vicinamibacteria bacterium]